MSPRQVLMPLPSYGFDPTEVAIPWQVLSERGPDVVFATPNGKPACADRLMLKGERLGIWKPILRARKDAVAAYQLTRLWLQDYYLTHPQLTVEDGVSNALHSRDHFLCGPTPLLRDDPSHLARGFTVRDKNYLSARWPGDAYAFSQQFAAMLA